MGAEWILGFCGFVDAFSLFERDQDAQNPKIRIISQQPNDQNRILILRATPSAAGPFSLETSWEILLATILTPREQPSIHLNIPCLFFSSDAFFLTFRDSIFAPREHLGRPFWHLGSALGCDFGVSGAPWVAILAPQGRLGGPWEQ